MSANNFGWTLTPGNEAIIDDTNTIHFLNDESRFLTKKLGVTYYIKEDNHRKAKGVDKYTKMAQRHSKLFSRQPYKWLMQRKINKNATALDSALEPSVPCHLSAEMSLNS